MPGMAKKGKNGLKWTEIGGTPYKTCPFCQTSRHLPLFFTLNDFLLLISGFENSF